MNENYDVIVLGTGLTECILSGILSVEGKKVLHIDRQDHYGGESASLNLTQLYSQFKPTEQPSEEYGRNRDWCVDLIPKFLMANGELTNILVHTDVTRYIEFKQVSGSYVYSKDGSVAKVPATEQEAISSPLMGLFEKRRMKKFLEFIASYVEDDNSTHQGLNLDTDTADDMYNKFGLESATKDFIGHAMALFSDDKYLTIPARDTYDRIILYVQSLARYGKSPYIYPLYGLGELPQGFARLSAIYGGTYMLSTPVDGIIYGDDGKATGIKSGSESANAPIIIGDPTYFADKVQKSGKKVIRKIFVIKNPIKGTDNSDSAQIIIPQSTVNRRNDIYIAVVSSPHHVCVKNFYLAIASTIIETDEPEKELEPAAKLIGKYEDVFTGIYDLLEPIEDGTKDNVFISKSYDASSHFESTTDDVKDLYKRITGKDLVLPKRARVEEEA